MKAEIPKRNYKVNKCEEQKSVRILTGKCMEQLEHNVQMDIWSLEKIFVFWLKMKNFIDTW